MLYGYSDKRIAEMHEADLAYGRALEEMLTASRRFNEIAHDLGATLPVETVNSLVMSALETAKTAPRVQGPLDRASPKQPFPTPHRPIP